MRHERQVELLQRIAQAGEPEFAAGNFIRVVTQLPVRVP